MLMNYVNYMFWPCLSLGPMFMFKQTFPKIKVALKSFTATPACKTEALTYFLRQGQHDVIKLFTFAIAIANLLFPQLDTSTLTFY